MDTYVPSLMNAVVLSTGGPYAPGDSLSIAFVRPTIGRLLKHDGTTRLRGVPDDDVVPHAVSVRIATDAEPYVAGDVVTLSFVDPSLARIHAGYDDVSVAPSVDLARRSSDAVASEAKDSRDARRDESGVPTGAMPRLDETAPTAPAPAAPDAFAVPTVQAAFETRDDEADGDADDSGIAVRSLWTVERAHRFVQVVDKLFTIDRLGWYRHVFAMRLLLPERIACIGDDVATATATRRLDAVRGAATATLGRPLLAAFMPNFSVSAEWLESIETPELARTLGDLRATIAPFARETNRRPVAPIDPAICCGLVARNDVDVETAACVDAFLATLIPSSSRHAALGVQLDGYRRALVDAFAQTSHSADAVRLGRMCEPNHALDDRLWQLVGLVGTSFGALAVA